MKVNEAKVWAIGVAFQPDTARLDATIESLLPQVTGVIVVDNTPSPSAELLRYWRGWTRRGVVVLALGRNLGIAAAQNIGARHALRRLGFSPLHEVPSGNPRETSGVAPREKSRETPPNEDTCRAGDVPGVTAVKTGEIPGAGGKDSPGAREARRARARGNEPTGGDAALLFFDQDSVFAPDYVAQIQAAEMAEYQRLVGDVAGGISVFGGLAFDHRETDPAKRDVLAYRDTPRGPQRYPDGELRENKVLPAAFLIASGLYVPVTVWRTVGPMNADMFIDHVDLEWSVRARTAGMQTLLVTGATIDHQLGDEIVKLPGRAQVVHVHSPFRVYYLVRNTCWLIRGLAPIPTGWRWGYVLWLAKFVAFNLVFAPGRRQRFTKILRGLLDGCRFRHKPREMFQPKRSEPGCRAPGRGILAKEMTGGLFTGKSGRKGQRC
ncbi:glycosyltransferase family protein [Mobiluncus mulieris]|uniref:glycosyltransferase n=1 Tax=Mobiluncus mulieris TaxID=2052 RepID=UPI0014700F4D|nr:glycosyltransferase [Mobiluncus mulieris]MCU9970982.1 glycosyltransferase [Mobiluncus mulieris]NMW90946.1 glycosyltransferase [Mobiluncus mulieris]